MKQNDSKYNWSFFKAGGMYQPEIASGADIAAIGELDMKFWAALGCPTRGLAFDEKTLDIIDTDSDGRVRRDDIVAACQWACSALKNPDTLLAGSDKLKLSDINRDSPVGARIFDCAEQILKNIGRGGEGAVAVSDFDDKSKIFADTPFNADGIITELSCEGDAKRAQTLALVIKSCGAKTDRSGRDGADADAIKSFFEKRAEFLAWNSAPKSDEKILPLGDKTAAASAALDAVAEKLDDYFTRAALAAYDPSAAAAVNPQTEQIGDILSKSQSFAEVSEKLKNLPVAKIDDKGLDLSSPTNPVFAGAIAAFRDACAMPILGTGVLDAAGWTKIKATLAPYKAWAAARPDNGVSVLGAETLAGVGESDKEKLIALVEKDNEIREHADNVAEVEKLVMLNKNLFELLRNFVNFDAFYGGADDAVFQFGRLFIDSRDCGLCIKVDDIAKHSAMAASSYGYLLYCVCKRKGEADLNIAAVVTAGDSDNLVVGRNGIFYDRKGRDWDATVVKIIQNPVGLGQAFWSPYKRLVKWASEQIAKHASDTDSKVMSNLTTQQPAAAKDGKKIDIGTVAALGVAVGGITTAFGMVLDAFLNLGYWIPLGIVGIMLAISLPSMIVAALKLRMRSLAPLLDANGWAVNCKAAVSVLFGARLTKVAVVPLVARRGKQKHRKIRLACVIFVLLAIISFGLWYTNSLEKSCGLPAPAWSGFAPKNDAAPQQQAAPATAQADKKPEATAAK